MKRLLTAILICQISFLSAQAKKQHHVVIMWQTKWVIPDSFMRTIESTVEDYDRMYGLYDSLLITDTLIPGKITKRGILTDNAFAVHRHITYNWAFLDVATCEEVRYTTAHELTHSVKPLFWTTILDTTRLRDGSILTGFYGLFVCNQFSPSSYFTKIEEASAEACARNLYPNYKTRNAYDYDSACVIMMTAIEKHWLTANDLVSAVKSNDVLCIVALLLNKSVNDVYHEELVSIMRVFNEAFYYPMYRKQLDWIERYRKH